MQFFGKGTGFDPFDFLDSAPAIKAPLDLGDTDSDDDAASSVSLGSTSTTASTTSSISVSAADAAQASTSKTPAARPKVKPVIKLPDMVSSVDDAEGFIPRSFADIHSTGLPSDVQMRRSGTTTSKGSSLYICPHPSCGSTPYIGDLYGCSSHLRRVHYGTCLACPYCPNQKYYRVSGWKKHMASKHAAAPWYGASETTQASLILKSVQEEIETPPTTATEAPTSTTTSEVEFRFPSPSEISTVPLKPTVVEEPPPESLPYTAEEDDDTLVSIDIDPEEEQELLGAEGGDDVPRRRSPSLQDICEASAQVPSDTRHYEYARNVQGTMESRYLKSDDPSQESAIALVKQDLPSSSGDPSGPPPPKKSKSTK